MNYKMRWEKQTPWTYGSDHCLVDLTLETKRIPNIHTNRTEKFEHCQMDHISTQSTRASSRTVTKTNRLFNSIVRHLVSFCPRSCSFFSHVFLLVFCSCVPTTNYTTFVASNVIKNNQKQRKHETYIDRGSRERKRERERVIARKKGNRKREKKNVFIL